MRPSEAPPPDLPSPPDPAAPEPQRRHWRALGGGLLCAASFLALSRIVLSSPAEGRLAALDRAVLRAALALRRPWLNGAAVDVTALGSPTLLAPASLIAAVVLLRRNDRRGVLLVAASGLGAAVGELVVKTAARRARPSTIPHLVHVSSFSYPSGHALASAALYLGIATAFSRGLPARPRILTMASASALATLVAASRVYLGVHYPTDVAAGLAFGFGWTLLVAGLVDYHAGRRR